MRVFCIGFAGMLCVLSAAESRAQAPALKVDPTLLGLPPLKSGEVPAPAPTPTSAEKPKVEVRPVEPVVVEARPSDPAPAQAEKAVSQKQPPAAESASARNPTPAPAPIVAAPAPVSPRPVTPAVPVAPASPAVPRQAAAPAPVPAAAREPLTPAPPLKSETAPVTAMAPLKVDPALLGLPPIKPVDAPPVVAQSPVPAGKFNAEVRPVVAQTTGQAAPAGGTAAGATGVGRADAAPPVVASRGPRDEESVDDPLPPLALRPSRTLSSLASKDQEPRPTFLMAQRISGQTETEMVAEGNAELRKIGTVLRGNRLSYWPLEDEMEAEGSVILEQGDDVISGPKMRMKMEDQVGYFEQPTYTIRRQPSPTKGDKNTEYVARGQGPDGGQTLSAGYAMVPLYNLRPGQTKYDPTKRQRVMTEGRGEAERIDFEGENQVRVTNGTYTTCAPGNDDWYVKAASLKLDYDNEVADGTDGTLYFKGVPILHSPWLSFALNHGRKTGFLAPSYGTNSESGFEIDTPFYWNIAPNMDATITPRVMTKRGTQINNDFRYLDTALGGMFYSKLRAEYLANDRLQDGDKRWGVAFQHHQTMGNGFTTILNYNKVSDNNYYTDLASRIAQSSQTQLLQQGMVSYGGGGWWSVTANVQQYQTLQPDPKNRTLEPYRMLPQISLNARRPDWGMADASLLGQYTNFTRKDFLTANIKDTRPDGQRTVVYPQVAIPFVTPAWYVTPKIGANIRHYSLDNQALGTSSSISTSLPIASVDSGMTFERTSNLFGKDYTQTLEPRLYYVYIPYKDQSKIPLFDTSVADFNFAQIFSENLFSGWDRINNANQLTAAVSSRLLDPNSGTEIMRAMIGQRLYFSRQRVGLQGPPSDSLDSSDFLAAFSGQIFPRVYADTAWQFTPADSRTRRFSLGGRYQPEPGKVFNAAYRYNMDMTAPVNQVDFSGQWPLTGKLYAVGRLNYSLKDDRVFLATKDQGGRLVEAIGGLEYNGGCWVIRGVLQRRALTQDNSTTSFFIQLELNDFARIGSNPLNLLKRNVQGYSMINQPFDNSFNDSF